MTEKENKIVPKDGQPQSKKDRIKAEIIEWVESLFIAFIIAMFIRTFFIQPFKIPSESMTPTLIKHDRLMVNKLDYGPKVPFTKKRIPGFKKMKRGDVMVFVFPGDNKRDFIKRLVAFGGETVEINDGKLFINGRIIEEKWAQKRYYYNFGEYAQSGIKTKVPEGNVFVLGDNSASSHDSRYWGFVPEVNIVGRAEFIFWPFKRIRWINEN
ncbi:MAG: signal peptidase I [Candidatus Omnitrophica bacterium]|nr:signal peptidase I [Candidatus Omnitrophota bacterium]